MEQMLDIPSTHANYLIVERILFSKIYPLSDIINPAKFPNLNSAYPNLKDVDEPTEYTKIIRHYHPINDSLRRAYIATLIAGCLSYTDA
jgi:hypothetical protein